MFEIKLTDALAGRAQELWRKRRLALHQSVSEAMRETESEAKEALRGQVLAAGMGQDLANTWRGEVFPRKGVSAKAAAVIYSKAPYIIAGQTQGEPIRASGGSWLAIPSQNAPKRLPRFGKIAAVERRFGKLQFVPLKPAGGGPRAMLIAPQLQRSRGKRGGFRKASASAIRRRKTERVVMFFLVRLARPARRLAPPAETGRSVAGKVPGRVSAAMQRRLEGVR